MERALKAKTLFNSKVKSATDSFDSIANAAADRAKVMMKKRLKVADSEAELRILASMRALDPEMVRQQNLVKEARLAAKRLDELQFAKQASKKGDMMSSLQDVLQRRRAIMDSEYSLESTVDRQTTTQTEVKEAEKKKSKKSERVPIIKGRVPLPPSTMPPKKEEKRVTPPKKGASKKSVEPAAEKGDFVDELRQRFKRSKKEKKGKKDKEIKKELGRK